MNRRVRLGIAVCVLAAAVPFVGVYRDREWSEPYFFVKDRPTLKMSFFAPLGESSLHIADLSATLQEEEIAYHRYVETQGGYRRSFRIGR
jgi:hypothetical protein